MFHGARILVAPLDWGLGHAARCVPVIQALMAHGAVPVLGADKGPLELLRREFPTLEHVRVPGIEVRYGGGTSQLWSMALQFPAMVRSIRTEQALFDRLKRELRLDAVISDQRFGLRCDALPSVLVTHQIFPFTPIAQGALRKANHRHIARFDRCWVMDEADAPGLAGELSHGSRMPGNARYIGTLSRFAKILPAPPDHPYRIVALISGPEPHRTLLEDALLEQLPWVDGEHLLVQGLPATRGERVHGRVRVVGHLPSGALAGALRSTELIISRSGYTTLMDLAAIGRSALIIPTPGQPEQEYLGRLHGGTGRFLVQRQRSIDLGAALAWHGPVTEPLSAGPLLAHALKDLAALMGR